MLEQKLDLHMHIHKCNISMRDGALYYRFTVAGAYPKISNGGPQSKTKTVEIFGCVACPALHFIELPCQTSFCPFYIYFFSLLSAAQHLTLAVVYDSRLCSSIFIACV